MSSWSSSSISSRSITVRIHFDHTIFDSSIVLREVPVTTLITATFHLLAVCVIRRYYLDPRIRLRFHYNDCVYLYSDHETTLESAGVTPNARIVASSPGWKWPVNSAALEEPDTNEKAKGDKSEGDKSEGGKSKDDRSKTKQPSASSSSRS